MPSAHDIAAFILGRKGPMSAMKLQKLVYYSQAWSVALTNRPLFRESFQAWAHGPVVYELFAQHRGQFVVSEWPSGDATNLDRAAVRIVEGVIGHYGEMSAEALSDLTHREDPWKLARSGLPAGYRTSATISIESMRRFYTKQPIPPSLVA